MLTSALPLLLLIMHQGLGRALRHVLRFCCLFAVHGDAKDISSLEVAALHDAFQYEMKLLVPVSRAMSWRLKV